jgi:hypothetical protein
MDGQHLGQLSHGVDQLSELTWPRAADDECRVPDARLVLVSLVLDADRSISPRF